MHMYWNVTFISESRKPMFRYNWILVKYSNLLFTLNIRSRDTLSCLCYKKCKVRQNISSWLKVLLIKLRNRLAKEPASRSEFFIGRTLAGNNIFTGADAQKFVADFYTGTMKKVSMNIFEEQFSSGRIHWPFLRKSTCDRVVSFMQPPRVRP